MATDNRHRPGPGFRCPNCRGNNITFTGRDHVVKAGRFTRRRTVECQCRNCGREWASKHRLAIAGWEEEHPAATAVGRAMLRRSLRQQILADPDLETEAGRLHPERFKS